jgi:hypothetical protein
VTSERQLRANRANAQASTGPKTRRGKIRAAQNARRHGLSLSVLTDPLLCEDAETLACALAGEQASDALLEAARRASEAQIDLVRIRRARHDLLVRRLQKVQPTPEASRTSNLSEPKSPQNKSTVMLTEIPEEFTLLDRYERRALSRRKFAIRELDALRQPTSP